MQFNHRSRLLAVLLLGLGFWLCPAHAQHGHGPIKIGVLSHRGHDLTMAHWKPTADYLSEQLDDYYFEIIPLPFSRIKEYVDMEYVDFLLVNPGIYVDLEVSYGISRLTTLNNRVAEQSLNQFSSVIFTLSDRDDIGDEFLKHGIDPFKDFAELSFARNHDSVVLSVLDGDVDAGTVRTNILERMAAEGTIELGEFKVINAQRSDGFPFAHSTTLYPEWPFSKVSHTPSDLAQQVAVALLNMPAEHPAALAGNYAGWTVPLDYQPVHDLFQRLKVPPYQRDFTLADVVQRYLFWIAGGMILILLFAYLLYWIWRLNRQLFRAKSNLEAEHLLILNSVADGIYGVDCDGNSTFINRAMEEMTGWSTNDMVGRNQHEMLHHTRADGSHFPSSDCPVLATCQDGQPRYIREDLFWRKDGNNFPVEYACSPLKNGNGRIVGSVVVFRDIGERKKIEEASRQHQHDLEHMGRVNTMGEMAAGIAHEINQPLAAITSSAQASIRMMDAGLNEERTDKLGYALEMIAMQAQRGGNIIRQLREFVKKDVPVKTYLDINELVQKVVLLISPEALRVGVRIVTQLQANLPKVWVQDIQIQQVILNLATNAIEAMGDERVKQRRLTITTEQNQPGQVDVVVSDTGMGVSEEMQSELFKQFVTTKSQGMGLGLSISKGIIDAHDGNIFIEKSSQNGTVFRFTVNASN
jgi:two-component system sensor histidine kinase TtrS